MFTYILTDKIGPRAVTGPWTLDISGFNDLSFVFYVTAPGDNCPDPGTPAGASRSGNIFGIGDTVKYSCNGNLFLVGSSERECQENGQWTGTEPACYCKRDTYKYCSVRTSLMETVLNSYTCKITFTLWSLLAVTSIARY